MRTIDGISGSLVIGISVFAFREAASILLSPIPLIVSGVFSTSLGEHWHLRLKEMFFWDTWLFCCLMGSLVGLSAYFIATSPAAEAQRAHQQRRLYLFAIFAVIIAELIRRMFAFTLLDPSATRLVTLEYIIRGALQHPVTTMTALAISAGLTVASVWLIGQLLKGLDLILERWF